jgi:N-acetylglucosamine kinase-like BadF-type ATPase
MSNQRDVLVSVDGGQTSTKALVAAFDGTILGAGQGGPSDHFTVVGGVEKNRLAIHGAIQTALERAGIAPTAVRAIGLGLTGAPPDEAHHRLVENLVREIVTPDRIVVNPDYVSNLAGASGGGTGVVVIAGGGAIAFGVTEDGLEALASGYGYLLGDEGSAFDIGRQAIRAAAYAGDRRGEPTQLEQIVLDHFEIPVMRQLPRVVYVAGFSRDAISQLAPKVAQAAHAGDPAALSIMTRAGRELALAALGVLRQLFPVDAPVNVFRTGGVFEAGDVLMIPFRHTLSEGWPSAQDREPRFPPAVGGLILAARAQGLTVNETWLSQVAKTLGGVMR